VFVHCVYETHFIAVTIPTAAAMTATAYGKGLVMAGSAVHVLISTCCTEDAVHPTARTHDSTAELALSLTTATYSTSLVTPSLVLPASS
jgi:hypothetical protein